MHNSARKASGNTSRRCSKSVSEAQLQELNRIKEAAAYAHSLGLTVNAGHGLNYTNTQNITAVPYMHEFNIGHSIISKAVFTGLEEAVKEMIKIIKK